MAAKISTAVTEETVGITSLRFLTHGVGHEQEKKKNSQKISSLTVYLLSIVETNVPTFLVIGTEF